MPAINGYGNFSPMSRKGVLFRQESSTTQGQFYLLSEKRPQQQHNLFQIGTKPYEPQLVKGMTLFFNLRANPVITRQGKRSDVMMDAKFHAKNREYLPVNGEYGKNKRLNVGYRCRASGMALDWHR